MAKGLFDHINHIKFKQDKNYYDSLSHEDRKSYSTFMILKFLSMDIELTHMINYLNQFHGKISDSQMYRFIIEMIPVGKYQTYNLKNKNNNDKNSLEIISEIYNISEKKAFEYLNIMSDDEINYLYESLGKKRK